MRMILRSPWLLAALMICIIMPAFPQSGAGVVRGTVFDPARASVPGVKIQITHVATNTTKETPSNDIGFFLFSGLQPGDYKLVAEAKEYAAAGEMVKA